VVVELFAVGDESGIQAGAPYCLISGYIGSAKEWLAFEPQWEAVLKGAGVQWFHARQFFGRGNDGRRLGPYGAWTDDDARVFLSKLAGVINQRRLRPIGVAVDTGAFNALTEGERRWLTGGLWAARPDDLSRGRWTQNTGAPTKPYYLAFQFFLVQAAQSSVKDAQISFLFDRQNVLQAQAINMFQQTVERGLIKIEGYEKYLRWIAYGNSPDEPSLQAADLHTHAWYGTLARGPDLEWERSYAMDLLTKKRTVMGICNADYLEQLLTRLPADVRKRLRQLA